MNTHTSIESTPILKPLGINEWNDKYLHDIWLKSETIRSFNNFLTFFMTP